MGDGCLAIFDEGASIAVVDALAHLDRAVAKLAQRLGLEVDLGANVHLTSVIDCELGSGASRRRDVIGRGVNQTFLLGHGAGVRISEPVYRSLPSGMRSPWEKYKPPAIYRRGAAEKAE